MHACIQRRKRMGCLRVHCVCNESVMFAECLSGERAGRALPPVVVCQGLAGGWEGRTVQVFFYQRPLDTP